MEIDKWVNGCKIRSFPWIDGKTIYFNVKYYKPGQSIHQQPVWDKTVYITDNEAGRHLALELTSSFVEYVASLTVQAGTKIVITA